MQMPYIEGALGTVSLLAGYLLLSHHADYALLLGGIALGLFVGAAIRLLDSRFRWPTRTEVLGVLWFVLVFGSVWYRLLHGGLGHGPAH